MGLKKVVCYECCKMFVDVCVCVKGCFVKVNLDEKILALKLF